MTDHYAVIGNPITHSQSPRIHRAFKDQFEYTDTPQGISYDAVFADLDKFESTVRDLFNGGYKGANVTVPFKFEAYQICDTVSARVISSGSGAVNTLINNNGQIHGDNTDGVGLQNDIEQNLGFSIANKRILILGAGGAAAGVLTSLLAAKSITIANRTLEKALAISTNVSNCIASRFEDLDTSFDLIINATSTGLTDSGLPIADSVFGSDCLAYEMMYGRETPFMAQARRNRASVTDGLGMLVEQAAEAFYLWRGVHPKTAPVIQALREGKLL